jgi:hypothetical protein
LRSCSTIRRPSGRSGTDRREEGTR